MKKNFEIGIDEILLYIKKLRIFIFSIFFFSILFSYFFYFSTIRNFKNFRVIIETPSINKYELFNINSSIVSSSIFQQLDENEKFIDSKKKKILKELKIKNNIFKFQESFDKSIAPPILRFDFQKYSLHEEDHFLVECQKSKYDCEEYIKKYIRYIITQTSDKLKDYFISVIQNNISDIERTIKIDKKEINILNAKIYELKKLANDLKEKDFTNDYPVYIFQTENRLKLHNYIFVAFIVATILSTLLLLISISKNYSNKLR
jgi:hypothetical protein